MDLEFVDFRAAFRTYDRDHNGTLNHDELNDFLMSLGFTVSKSELNDIMNDCLYTGTELTFEQFMTLMTTHKYFAQHNIDKEKKIQKNLQHAFHLLDREQNTYLDREELKAILQKYGVQPAEFETVFKKSDLHDRIDLKEFLGDLLPVDTEVNTEDLLNDQIERYRADIRRARELVRKQQQVIREILETHEIEISEFQSKYDKLQAKYDALRQQAEDHGCKIS